LRNFCEAVIAGEKMQADFLDMSLLTSEPRQPHLSLQGVRVHGAAALPLPCSCYPNHALNQVNDAMAGIYERWSRRTR